MSESRPPDDTPRPANDATLEAFDAFLVERGLSLDDFCEVLAAAWRQGAETEDNQAVRDCLFSAAEHLSQAGMDWYVSTK